MEQKTQARTVKLEDLIILRNGKSKTLSKLGNNGKYPVFGGNGIIGLTNEYLIDKPTIVIGRVGAYCGSVHIAPSKSWITDNAMYCTVKVPVNLKFIYYLFRNLNFNKFAKNNAQPSISQSLILDTEILFPPVDIQNQIVKQLDYLLQEMEERQRKILEWHKDIELNGHILYKEALGRKFSSIMELNSDIPNAKRLHLQDISESIVPGFTQGRKNVVNGITHLRMNNIGTNFEINLDLTRTVDATSSQLKKYRLVEGDVLFNNTNSSSLVGKSAIFSLSDTVCLYSNHLTRIRPLHDIVLSEWLLFYIRSRWLNGDFERICNKWVNQAAVPNEKIRNFVIPVPSIEIQKKKIEELKRVSSVISQIKYKLNNIINHNRKVEEKFKKVYDEVLRSAFSITL